MFAQEHNNTLVHIQENTADIPRRAGNDSHPRIRRICSNIFKFVGSDQVFNVDE